MKTNNALIAEFMEMVPNPHDKGSTWSFKELVYRDPNGQVYGIWVLPKYDTSWDWLMPVVQKTLKTTEPKEGQGWSHEYKQLADARLGFPIESVYQLVVTFIKYYNAQNN